MHVHVLDGDGLEGDSSREHEVVNGELGVNGLDSKLNNLV